eukprot:gene57335-biopygen28122
MTVAPTTSHRAPAGVPSMVPIVGCSASSERTSAYSCDHAYDGLLGDTRDDNGKVWASSGEGIVVETAYCTSNNGAEEIEFWYTAVTPTDSPPTCMTMSMVELPGRGFCQSAFIGGFDGLYLDLEECKAHCISEPSCKAISFCDPANPKCVFDSYDPGRSKSFVQGSCSRYMQPCSLTAHDAWGNHDELSNDHVSFTQQCPPPSSPTATSPTAPAAVAAAAAVCCAAAAAAARGGGDVRYFAARRAREGGAAWAPPHSAIPYLPTTTPSPPPGTSPIRLLQLPPLHRGQGSAARYPSPSAL